MKRLICVVTVILLLTAGVALADQSVSLPGGFSLTVPDNMSYDGQAVEDSGSFCFAYVSGTLEMDVFSYSSSGELRQMVEEITARGNDAELRSINGIEAICYRGTDPADGAPFIGYVMKRGNKLTEVVFWYADQNAANLTKIIMETLQ